MKKFFPTYLSPQAILVILLPVLLTANPLLTRAQKEEQDPLKLNATLIQVPALVSDRSGKFIADLAKADFSLFEDGKRQEVALLSTLHQPFNAVLVLDTSNSAEDRLYAIQQIALGFVDQLADQDRMMVISFDHEVRQLTDFTSNRAELQAAIKATESGFGKLLHEATTRAIEQLKTVEGRRAMILFSDGVDMKSIEASAESTIKLAEEVGAVVYVVRFDTRWWIEAQERKHKKQRPEKELPFEVDVRIPLPPEYGGPQVPGGLPRVRIEMGSPQGPPITVTDEFGRRRPLDTKPQDEITKTLDKLYGEAEAYIQALTTRTAGAVFPAETFEATRSAFVKIAEELRHQYLLGYYPLKEKPDGKYHKIKVEVARKDARVRARPGYR
jgi:Ca-activated chloride channel homolog